MKKNKVIILFSLLFIFILFSSIAYAPDNFDLGNILGNLQGFDIGKAYEQYPLLIDAVLYFIIFVGIAQAVLSKKFEGRGGKAVVVGVGVTLAIAIIFWEANVLNQSPENRI